MIPVCGIVNKQFIDKQTTPIRKKARFFERKEETTFG